MGNHQVVVGPGANRIDEHPVLGRRDNQRFVSITVDGVALDAIDGEPIAAALLAHGRRVCRTMPETHHPRGVFCGVGRCPDCAMIVDGELNVMTCLTLVRAGMRVETQYGLGQWTPDGA